MWDVSVCNSKMCGMFQYVTVKCVFQMFQYVCDVSVNSKMCVMFQYVTVKCVCDVSVCNSKMCGMFQYVTVKCVGCFSM